MHHRPETELRSILGSAVEIQEETQNLVTNYARVLTAAEISTQNVVAQMLALVAGSDFEERERGS